MPKIEDPRYADFYVHPQVLPDTKSAMESHGMPEPPPKDDHLVRRLFWPRDRAGDAEFLGEQGLWLCFIVTFVLCAVLGSEGQYTACALTFVFFALGGIGVREHSSAAAILVAVAFVLNQIANAMSGIIPNVFAIIGAILLLINIRSTRIARRWAYSRDHHHPFAEEWSKDWRERIVDQMPALVWPKTRTVFFCVSGIYLLLVFIGIATAAWRLTH